jgi:outer membrane protein OmpA-like peptidoglycan-associated protein
MLAVQAVFLLPMLQEKFQWTREAFPKVSSFAIWESIGSGFSSSEDETPEVSAQNVVSAEVDAVGSPGGDDVTANAGHDLGNTQGNDVGVAVDDLYAPNQQISNVPVAGEAALDNGAISDKDIYQSTTSNSNGSPVSAPAAEVSAAVSTEAGYQPVVKTAAPARAGTQPVVKTAAPARAGTLNKELMLLVSFPLDSIELAGDVLAVLEEAGKLLNDNPGARAEIIGFADQAGDPIYNQNLSWERARAVEEYFVALGVEKSRLFLEGRGGASAASNESYPEAANGSERYRIVQIKMIPEQLR